ncbi:MAG: QueT transporter family protein [Thermoproteota archaeon]|nr:QueT transporter family protein [Candidatus Brockarchaeota archaeon]MBO3801282.1 QueT transporter family protein [Candidatus Brockarchaeota archaeon]
MNLKLRDLALVALISSIYAIGTVLIAPISYGIVQARLTDSLILLSYLPEFGWSAVFGVTLGNIIANFFSPYGLPDIVLGTLANLVASLSVMYISKLKVKQKIVIAALVASVEIALIVGIGLLYIIYSVASIELAFFSVFVGELISVVLVGIILIKAISNIFRMSK